MEAGTPRRFLRGDMGDPAAAARSDLSPAREGLPRTVPKGAVSASQGSAFQWHRGSPVTQRRLDEEFAAAAAAQSSEFDFLPDVCHGDHVGGSGVGERDAPILEESKLVTGSLVLWSPAEGTGTRLAVVTELAFREREKNACSPWWDFLSLYDGEKEHAFSLDFLPTLKPVPTEVPRALMPALASTPEPAPRSTNVAGNWTWLSSLEGIDHAARIELPVRREAIPHIVGSKGKTIRALEEKFGVIIGVMDVPESGALVTFLGPQVPVLWARVTVELLARGARAALERIQWSPG